MRPRIAISSDATLTRAVVVPNAASDTDGDSVDDRLTSNFMVGGLVTLRIAVVQEVDSVPGNAIALLTQRYTITNVSGVPVNFSLVRIGDFDLVWNGRAELRYGECVARDLGPLGLGRELA